MALREENHLYSYGDAYYKRIMHYDIVSLQKNHSMSLSSADNLVPFMKELQYGLGLFLFFFNLMTIY